MFPKKLTIKLFFCNLIKILRFIFNCIKITRKGSNDFVMLIVNWLSKNKDKISQNLSSSIFWFTMFYQDTSWAPHVCLHNVLKEFNRLKKGFPHIFFSVPMIWDCYFCPTDISDINFKKFSLIYSKFERNYNQLNFILIT